MLCMRNKRAEACAAKLLYECIIDVDVVIVVDVVTTEQTSTSCQGAKRKWGILSAVFKSLTQHYLAILHM